MGDVNLTNQFTINVEGGGGSGGGEGGGGGGGRRKKATGEIKAETAALQANTSATMQNTKATSRNASATNQLSKSKIGATNALRGHSKSWRELNKNLAETHLTMARFIVVFRRVAFALIAFKAIDLITGSLGRFTSEMIRGNANMELMQTRLTQFYGSANQAAAALKYVTEIAVKTPFEIPNLTQAITVLKSFGLGAKEALTLAADTAAATAAPWEDLNTAIVETAIRIGKVSIGSKQLQRILPTLRADLGAYNQAIAEGKTRYEALTIALQRFSGMSVKLSQTAIGMISNINDKLGIISRKIGSLAFRKIREEIFGIFTWLDKINMNKVAKSAVQMEKTFKGILTIVKEIAKYIWQYRKIIEYFVYFKLLTVGFRFVATTLLSIGMATKGIATNVMNYRRALMGAVTPGKQLSNSFNLAKSGRDVDVMVGNLKGLRSEAIKSGESITKINRALNAMTLVAVLASWKQFGGIIGAIVKGVRGFIGWLAAGALWIRNLVRGTVTLGAGWSRILLYLRSILTIAGLVKAIIGAILIYLGYLGVKFIKAKYEQWQWQKAAEATKKEYWDTLDLITKIYSLSNKMSKIPGLTELQLIPPEERADWITRLQAQMGTFDEMIAELQKGRDVKLPLPGMVDNMNQLTDSTNQLMLSRKKLSEMNKEEFLTMYRWYDAQQAIRDDVFKATKGQFASLGDLAWNYYIVTQGVRTLVNSEEDLISQNQNIDASIDSLAKKLKSLNYQDISNDLKDLYEIEKKYGVELKKRTILQGLLAQYFPQQEIGKTKAGKTIYRDVLNENLDLIISQKTLNDQYLVLIDLLLPRVKQLYSEIPALVDKYIKNAAKLNQQLMENAELGIRGQEMPADIGGLMDVGDWENIPGEIQSKVSKIYQTLTSLIRGISEFRKELSTGTGLKEFDDMLLKAQDHLMGLSSSLNEVYFGLEQFGVNIDRLKALKTPELTENIGDNFLKIREYISGLQGLEIFKPQDLVMLESFNAGISSFYKLYQESGTLTDLQKAQFMAYLDWMNQFIGTTIQARTKLQQFGMFLYDLFQPVETVLAQLIDGTQKFGEILKNIAKDILKTISTIIVKTLMMWALGNIFNFLAPGMGFLSILKTFAGIPTKMQYGGYVQSNKPTLVGERGTEVFVPKASGRVYSSEETRRMTQPQQETIVIPLTVDGREIARAVFNYNKKVL